MALAWVLRSELEWEMRLVSGLLLEWESLLELALVWRWELESESAAPPR